MKKFSSQVFLGISAKFVYMEAGHVGQNIFLQSTALGLGTVSKIRP